jgi:hypothetical protein
MKTIPELIDSVAAENYPGTTFSAEVRANAAQLLERETRTRAVRALRKAVIQFRPQTEKAAVKPALATVPGNQPSKST